jgi:hypothetical protein
MGLLDNLLGGMIGGAQQGQSPLLQAALQLIQQNGGLPGIISKFEHGGMAEHAGSWVGTGREYSDHRQSVAGDPRQRLDRTDRAATRAVARRCELRPRTGVAADH